MSNTDRWEKRRKNNMNDDKELETRERLYYLDMYDQNLLELKKLANERKLHPKQHRAYDAAIGNIVERLEEMVMEQELPAYAVEQDIKQALEGGKYRQLYPHVMAPYIGKSDDDDDVIQLRKKKSSKTKPKRQLTKKRITKKPVKKVIRKPKHK